MKLCVLIVIGNIIIETIKEAYNRITYPLDPVLISLIRKISINKLAYDICGVQPMTGPTGLIFALKPTYKEKPKTIKEAYDQCESF